MRMTVQQGAALERALEIMNRCGPVTLPQLAKLMGKPNPHRFTRWLIENGYAGLIPSMPAKVCATGLVFKAPLTKTMTSILSALERLGSASSPDIAKEIGSLRETVDLYLRQANTLGLCHVSGDRQSEYVTNMRVYVWTYGPGENFVREKRTAGRPKKVKAPTTTVMTNARRDELTQALFGRAA
jgi:hypothetical protein